jgi:methionyl-tRNA formyltransferase
MEVVFLGINDAGWEIYEWLCERDDTSVRALVTKKSQLSLIETIQPDVVVATGFQHIVPPDLLDVPPSGCINVHPGYLPDTRGFNPNVWSIVEDRPAGATVHYMDEGVDTGDVIARRRVEKSFSDTGKSLYHRIETACVSLFKEIWPDVVNETVEATPQSSTGGAHHYKDEFEDLCELDPEAEYEVEQLLDRLRALTFPPFDNAVIEVDGDRYYVDIEIRRAEDANSVDKVGSVESY